MDPHPRRSSRQQQPPAAHNRPTAAVDLDLDLDANGADANSPYNDNNARGGNSSSGTTSRRARRFTERMRYLGRSRSSGNGSLASPRSSSSSTTGMYSGVAAGTAQPPVPQQQPQQQHAYARSNSNHSRSQHLPPISSSSKTNKSPAASASLDTDSNSPLLPSEEKETTDNDTEEDGDYYDEDGNNTAITDDYYSQSASYEPRTDEDESRGLTMSGSATDMQTNTYDGDEDESTNNFYYDEDDLPLRRLVVTRSSMLEGTTPSFGSRSKSPQDAAALEKATRAFEALRVTGGASNNSVLTFDSKEGSSVPTPIANNIHRVGPKTPRRARVPGGAAAKLMLVGPTRTAEDNDNDRLMDIEQIKSNESGFHDPVKIREIEEQMQRAKAEFQVGSHENRRYQQPSPLMEEDHAEDSEKKMSSSSSSSNDVAAPTGSKAPSFLNRSEIFPENPAAAVLALVTPRHGGDHRSVISSTFDNNEAPALTNTPSSPSRSIAGGGNDNHNDSPLNKRGISQPLLSEHAERWLERIKTKMRNPNKTLTNLLTAIATPNDKSTMDLGYMVRRKNACGALHVLTTQASNRIPIGWTVGVLPALASVLEDSQDEGGVMGAFPDVRIRTEYLAARTRAVAALLNLSTPKENRVAVFHTAGLVQALLGVICEQEEHKHNNNSPQKADNKYNGGPDLRGCTAILGFLVKSPENRLLLAHVPGFMDAIAAVLMPKPALSPSVPTKSKKNKKIYPWSQESEDDDDDSHGGSDDGSGTYDDDDETHKNNTMKSTMSYYTSYSKTTDGSDIKVSSYEDGSKTTFDDEHSELSPSSPRGGETARSHDPDETTREADYDATADKFLRMSRQNLFAVLLHMSKEKDNAYHFARDHTFVSTMVEISKIHPSPSHELATKLLANLTRHRLNSKILVFQKRIVVPALVLATASPNDEVRRFACHGLQNIAQDKSCRQELATTKNLIVALCHRARQATRVEERLAAVSALKNLCDEPANLIPMTNSPDCISTLMHVAHGKESGTTTTMVGGGAGGDNTATLTPMMKYRACDALATLSHWLRKIATSGMSLEATQQGKPPTQGLCVPSLRVVSWNQWE